MKKALITLLLVFSFINLSLAQAPNWSSVQKILGQKGMVQGDTIRATFPRSDLKKLVVNGVTVNPALAAVSWAAFKPAQEECSVMSADFALLQNEVDPVIKKLLASDIEITALKNHMYGESPKMVFLHCEGQGDPAKLAQAFKNALKLTKTPMPAKIAPPKATVNWNNVEAVMKLKGKKEGTIIRFTIPRADKIVDNNIEVTPLMGAAEEVYMQKIGDKVTATGDFALTSKEVNPVIKTLTQNGIKVTALHNHTLNEEPRTFYIHYWGYGQPEKIAKALRDALNNINIIK